MTDNEVLTAWRHCTGLTQARAAALLGLGLRTYIRYEMGDTRIPDTLLMVIGVMPMPDFRTPRNTDAQDSHELTDDWGNL